MIDKLLLYTVKIAAIVLIASFAILLTVCCWQIVLTAVKA